MGVKVQLIQVAALVATLLVTASASAQRPGGPMGPGGNWDITVDRTGSKQICHFNRINGNPGSQTVTPYDYDMLNGGVPSSSSLGYYGYWTTYYPTSDMKPAYASNGVDIVLKVKTTYTWRTTAGTPPATLKLCLDGSANANWSGQLGGGCQASNGLGHPEVRASAPTSGSVSVTGKRYREFPVRNGKVTIVTTLTSSSSATGERAGFGAGCSYNVAETPWSVKVVSDRDTTYRRVSRPDGIWRIANFLADDGETLLGGDGKGYGDSVATEPNVWNGGERDFASGFRLEWPGPWDLYATVRSMTSSASLDGPGGAGYQYLRCGYNNIPASTSKPLKEFTVTGSANDPVNAISDTYTYLMRVHLKAQKEDVLKTFAGDYIYWAKDDPVFADYHADVHIPTIVFSKENALSTPVSLSLTETNTLAITAGFEYTATAGAELTVELAKILFNESFKVTGQISVTTTTSQTGNYTIPANRRLEVWRCPSGSLVKHRTSRWGDSGYEREAIDYELSSYSVNLKYWERNLADVRRTPHMSDGAPKP